MTAPLFLRFLNLLMNDAIFLLDEAIQVKGQEQQEQQTSVSLLLLAGGTVSSSVLPLLLRG